MRTVRYGKKTGRSIRSLVIIDGTKCQKNFQKIARMDSKLNGANGEKNKVVYLFRESDGLNF